jgi:hypothetical protein
MTTFLESIATEQHEAILAEDVEKLCEAIHECATALKQNPASEANVEALEQHCVEAAHMLLASPEVAPEIVAPLGEAVQTLYQVGPKVDLRVTETLGEIAAGIPTDVAERDIFVKIAMVRATEFFRQQHTNTNEIGKELDDKLLKAFESAIDSTNSHLTFQEAFDAEMRRAFREVEDEYVDTSAVGEYRRDELLVKSDRLASYARNGRDVEAEMTGAVIPSDDTGPIEIVELTPSSDNEEAFNAWKKRLASNVTYSIARQAMRDDEYERVATADDINALRAELDSLYPAVS